MDKVLFYDHVPGIAYTAEDKFSSLFILGISTHEKWVRLYNAREWSSHEGYFNVKLPGKQILVVIETLHVYPPPAWPQGAIDRIIEPPDRTFADRLSSLHFGYNRP